MVKGGAEESRSCRNTNLIELKDRVGKGQNASKLQEDVTNSSQEK